MTRSTLLSASQTEYSSVVTLEAKSMAGVTFTIRRMSLGQRIELTRKIRELSQKAEFLQAGSEVKDRIEATLLASEIDRVYLEWGLVEIGTLLIDGAPATPETLIARGPEELCREIVTAIRSECGLTEEERKN